MPRRAGSTRHRDRFETGVATVWALAWIGVCLMLGWVGLVVAMAEARQHAVDASADLVSLSAAASLERGGNACAVAARIATANAVTLDTCRVVGGDVVVGVHALVDLPFGLHVWASGEARAGPA